MPDGKRGKGPLFREDGTSAAQPGPSAYRSGTAAARPGGAEANTSEAELPPDAEESVNLIRGR